MVLWLEFELGLTFGLGLGVSVWVRCFSVDLITLSCFMPNSCALFFYREQLTMSLEVKLIEIESYKHEKFFHFFAMLILC